MQTCVFVLMNCVLFNCVFVLINCILLNLSRAGIFPVALLPEDREANGFIQWERVLSDDDVVGLNVFSCQADRLGTSAE